MLNATTNGNAGNQMFLRGLDGQYTTCEVGPETKTICDSCPSQSFRSNFSCLILATRMELSCNYLTAENAVKEYSRFLQLKCWYDDFDCVHFTPSPLIDKVWKLHLVETRDYLHTCKRLYRILHMGSGRFQFFHRGVGQKYRLNHTKQIYQQRFHSPPDELYWSSSTDFTRLQGLHKYTVTCCLGDFIFRNLGMPACQCRLIFAGRGLESEMRLVDCEIPRESVLQVMLRVRGC